MKPISNYLFALLLLLPSFASLGQTSPWPSKSIKVIVPFAAGSAADSVARIVVEGLSKNLGQAFVIENKPGAGGTVGSNLVAQAAPDGYTLLIHSNSHTVGKFVYEKLSFDPEKDLVGVTPLASMSLMFVTSPTSGFKTLQELVQSAKDKPGSMNYASAGSGSATHLGAELLRINGDFSATHIPTKGTTEALTEVLSGRVQFFLSPLGLAGPFVNSSRLVGLAVVDSKRSKAFADVPTTSEAGVNNAEYPGWTGMFVPAKTPSFIIDRLNKETAAVLADPEAKKRLDTLYLDSLVLNPEEFARFLAKDFALTSKLVDAAGLGRAK